MNNKDNLFPKFTRSIENLIEDEEGSIPANKLLMLGGLVVVLGSLLSMEVFAKHRSHSSHSSHSSHRSGSSHRSHTSHSSHANTHGSHSSHASHTSHSNGPSHSNSLYSAEGDVKYSAPAASSVPGVVKAPVAITENTFTLPEVNLDVNENIEVPNGTPVAEFLPGLAIPATTPGTRLETGELNKLSATEKIR